MIKRVLSLAAVTIAVLIAVPAHAASERITSYDSQAILSKSNVLEVTETITYDFGTNVKHGIYRKIATDYPTANGKHYYLDVNYRDVTDQNGKPYQAEASKDNNGVAVLKIGDPNQTVSGVHVYQLHYTVQPIVTAGDSGQLLNFNVVGNNWEVPIDTASATVTLPPGINPISSACYTGKIGSKDHNCQIVGATVAAQNLAPGEGLTAAFDLPAGTVSNVATPSNTRYSAEDIGWAIAILLGVLAVLVWILVKTVRVTQERRRKHRQTVIAQYEAPDGLTPGEIGYLVDDTSNMVEITATLIDLAVRGHLKITQTRAKGFLKSARYTVTKLSGGDTLRTYESSLYSALFSTGDEVDMHYLDRTRTAAAVQIVHKALKQQLTTRGYYADRKALKGAWRKVTQGGQLTDEGAKEWAEVEGFKLYLSVVEKDRLKFTDAPERTPERFSTLLPYAIALGVEQQWAEQFKDIDLTDSIGWYQGDALSRGVIAASLVSDLGSGFSTAVSSSFVSASSSSGGSSGGGFGGGGGGSW